MLEKRKNAKNVIESTDKKEELNKNKRSKRRIKRKQMKTKRLRHCKASLIVLNRVVKREGFFEKAQ